MSIPQVVRPNWLHDDSEEDLVGADWHQEGIRTSVLGLKNISAARNLPWHIGDQLTLVCTKPDGSPWRPMPDVMLHARGGGRKRAEMSVSIDGVPELIIEIASPTTWTYDVDTRAGKAWGYMHLGVINYLVFDPDGSLMGEQCRGWQIHEGIIRPWRPSARDNRYHALRLEISFRAEGDLLRIFDQDGQPVPFPHEQDATIHTQQHVLRHQEQALAQQEAQRQEQARRIAELEAELARLRGEG